jgi:hypothetical protein
MFIVLVAEDSLPNGVERLPADAVAVHPETQKERTVLP